VYGDKSCGELTGFVHCRNCPVYSAAGLGLLETQLPERYREERTAQFAVPKPYREQSRSSAVLFKLGNEWLALPTWMFQEVAEHRPIHSLPHRRNSAVLGLTNIRGELLLCVSLGHLLGFQTGTTGDLVRNGYHRLLVLHWQQTRAVFPVEGVVGPQRLHPEALKAPAATLSKSRPAFTRNIFYWEGRAVALLDPQRVLAVLGGNLA
jgi:chemotaxis-related protein WspD